MIATGEKTPTQLRTPHDNEPNEVLPRIRMIDNGAEGVNAAREGLLARYPLVLFFLLSFVFTWGYSWLVWAPLGLPDSVIAHCFGGVLDRLNRPFGRDDMGLE